MFKTIKFVAFSFVLSSFIIPSISFGQGDDVDTSGGISSCSIINTNLSYKNRKNNNKDDVVTLQDFLNGSGYLDATAVTGFFGKFTEKAVISFQQDNRLVATPPGFVGSGTRTKIQELSCNGTPQTSIQPITPAPITSAPISNSSTLNSDYSGVPKSNQANYMDPCAFGVKFNSLTGALCARSSGNLPRGCTSTLGYSSFSGVKCDSIPLDTLTPTPVTSPVMCTMEMVQCPDGSYAGRGGSKCEAQCSISTFTKAPYISSAVIGTDGIVIVKGQNLHLSGNYLQIDGGINSMISKFEPKEDYFQFDFRQFQLKDGPHKITITNSKTGNSNTLIFESRLNTIPSISIRITSPTLDIAIAQGSRLNISWDVFSNGNVTSLKDTKIVLSLINANTGLSLGNIATVSSDTRSYVWDIPPKGSFVTCPDCPGIQKTPEAGKYKIEAKVYTPINAFNGEGFPPQNPVLPIFLATSLSSVFNILPDMTETVYRCQDGRVIFGGNAQSCLILEKPPYISSAISDANGIVTVEGQNLSLLENYLQIDGGGNSMVSKFGVDKFEKNKEYFKFYSRMYELKDGPHKITITNSKTGNSNTLIFETKIDYTIYKPPYISSAISDANGIVTVEGQNLSLLENYLQIDGGGNSMVSKFGVDKFEKNKEYFKFDSRMYELKDGPHKITITNSKTGNSNTLIFESKLNTTYVTEKKQSIEITSPTLWSKYLVGQNLPIYWNSKNMLSTDRLKIEIIFTHNDTTNPIRQTIADLIVDSTPNTGSFLWKVPEHYAIGVQEGSFVIKITSLSSELFWISEANFYIYKSQNPVQSLSLIKPTPNSSYTVGQSVPIEWTPKTGDSYHLSLLRKNDPSFLRILSDDVSNIGSSNLSWLVPSSISAGNDYYLKISEGIYFRNTGYSSVFTISNQPVAILAPVVSISASPTSVTSGQSSTVTWSASNVNYCTVTTGSIDDYGPSQAPFNGSKLVGPLTSNRIATITCPGKNGTVATKSVAISVSAPTPVMIPMTIFAQGIVGVPYPTTQTITAISGSGARTWKISSGSLPTGLSLVDTTSTSARIVGVPTTAGTSNFTITVTDSTGSYSQLLSITVSAPSQIGGGGAFLNIKSPLSQNTQPAKILGDFASNVRCLDIPYNLIRGAESSYVTKLQTFLSQKGFLLESDITGIYRDKTMEAVKDYQASKNLPTTGMVYDFTRTAIQTESCR